MRSQVVLEVASELVGDDIWPYRQARVSLRDQGDERWAACFFGSDAPSAIREVARGEVQIAMINPAAPLALAARGTGPFQEPIPLRAITVMPSPDQLAFAVSAQTGLTSLVEIRERRYPLRVSLRKQPDHSIHLILREVLSAGGFSLEEIVAWGGEVRYDPGIPNSPGRIGAVERGEIDAIFDEALNTWGKKALELGMRFLPVDTPLLEAIEKMGLRRAVITKAQYPWLIQEVTTVDFSGWPIFTHADVPDAIVYAFCKGLEIRRDRILWEEDGPLPLERMCRDTPEGPLDILLHPAAQRFWQEQGYLP